MVVTSVYFCFLVLNFFVGENKKVKEKGNVKEQADIDYY